jgi:hypothetical protein
LKASTKGSNKKRKEKSNESQPPKKTNVASMLIAIIDPYSAKKNKAKPMLEYSTLNPDTSSLSASGRSNGALFVSAKIETKNIKHNGKKGIKKKT